MNELDTMIGLWIVRGGTAGDALLASVHDELYVLAFSSAVRAGRARDALGVDGRPFYIVAANVREVVQQAHAAGARGFILDYDPVRTAFAEARPLPAEASIALAPSR
jgi:hypothetical protein